MTEVKGIRRGTELLDDLRNRRRYWELKEEAEERKMWTQGRNTSYLLYVHEPITKQHT